MSITEPTRYDDEFPRPAPEPPPFWTPLDPVPCGSDALYRVEGTGIYHYCGPHLHMGLTDHLGEGTVIYDADLGRSCDYQEEL